MDLTPVIYACVVLMWSDCASRDYNIKLFFFLKKKEKSIVSIVVHTNDGPMMEKAEGRAFIFML